MNREEGQLGKCIAVRMFTAESPSPCYFLATSPSAAREEARLLDLKPFIIEEIPFQDFPRTDRYPEALEWAERIARLGGCKLPRAFYLGLVEEYAPTFF